MTKVRIMGTDHGITGGFNIQMYDRMKRNMRDKGWTETNLILKEGINSALVLKQVLTSLALFLTSARKALIVYETRATTFKSQTLLIINLNRGG